MNDTSTRGTNENMNGTSIKGTDLRPHLRKGPHARMGPAENGAPTDRKYQEALVTNGSVYPPPPQKKGKITDLATNKGQEQILRGYSYI